MVRDLLGDKTQPANGFVSETPLSRGVNFLTNTYTSSSALIVQQYQQAAEQLAQTAVSDANNLNNAILPCHTQDDACAQQFIASFANRAYRGQLDDAESTGLFQIYSTVKAQFDFVTGIQAVVTAVLQSPRFLYVLEFGAGTSGGAAALTSYEVAARLALFLWRSVPDATLMQTAAAGQLSTAAQVQAQAMRMLADPKAADAIGDFTTQWMELQSTPTLGKDTQFTAWSSNAQIGQELVMETLTNVTQAVLAENGGLADLLTSPTSYLNQDLAHFYDVPLGSGTPVTVSRGTVNGQSFFKTNVQPAGAASPVRLGLLTNAGVLATQSHTTLPSSVLRGKLVREQVLCDPIPPPPPNVPPAPTSVEDGGTTRSLFEAHEKIPGCVTCHQFMDPIGLGFGNFDATGAYQTTDANGFMPASQFPPIDASGQVLPMGAGQQLMTTFNGAADLATQLAAATEVKQCFALQEFRYALGRLESAADACSLAAAYGAFTSGQLNIQQLLVAITVSDAFRYRSVVTPGETCQ
jgi:hypothetical protein